MDETIDFLAASHSAQEIIAYQPGVVLQQRLHELLERNRDKQLTEEEQAELEDFHRRDRFMSRLKQRAGLSHRKMTPVGPRLRRLVVERAQSCGEYRLLRLRHVVPATTLVMLK